MAERDAAMAERHAALAEKLAGLVKAVSESVDSKSSYLSASVDGKLGNLEQRVQEQRKMFENRCPENSATRPSGTPYSDGCAKRYR